MTTTPNPDPFAGLAAVGDRARALRATMATMKAAWPAGVTFPGHDVTGDLTVEIASDGRVVRASLAQGWTATIGARGLARALNQAIGAASAALGDAWVESWDAPDAAEVAPTPRPARLTLEEYRRAFPPPRTREELRAKADRAAEVREEAARRQSRLASEGSAREEFVSASGRFRVVRSRAAVMGLEAEPNALALMTPDDVARDLVAICAEVEQRASVDAHGPLTTRLAEVRQRRAELDGRTP